MAFYWKTQILEPMPHGNFNTCENICLGEIKKKVFCGFELKHMFNLKDDNAFLMFNKC
jgi:hypothetical protein